MQVVFISVFNTGLLLERSGYVNGFYSYVQYWFIIGKKWLCKLFLFLCSILVYYWKEVAMQMVPREDQGTKKFHRLIFLREDSVSRHNGGPIEDPPWTPQYDTVVIVGGASIIAPWFRETQASRTIMRLIAAFFPVWAMTQKLLWEKVGPGRSAHLELFLQRWNFGTFLLAPLGIMVAHTNSSVHPGNVVPMGLRGPELGPYYAERPEPLSANDRCSSMERS